MVHIDLERFWCDMHTNFVLTQISKEPARVSAIDSNWKISARVHTNLAKGNESIFFLSCIKFFD
jgi:hypothetical protein